MEEGISEQVCKGIVEKVEGGIRRSKGFTNVTAMCTLSFVSTPGRFSTSAEITVCSWGQIWPMPVRGADVPGGQTNSAGHWTRRSLLARARRKYIERTTARGKWPWSGRLYFAGTLRRGGFRSHPSQGGFKITK